MSIVERIDCRVAELNDLIAKHDRHARDAQSAVERIQHAEKARGYAQAKLELVRIKVAAAEASP